MVNENSAFISSTCMAAFHCWSSHWRMYKLDYLSVYVWVLQEKQAKKIKSQTEIINNLEQDKKIWQEDYKELNRKNAELLIIQKVQVKIKNYEKYKIDHLSIMEAENRIKDDLSSLIAKDLYNTYKNKDLVYKTIENRIDKFNNRPYKYTIKNIVFYSTISIELEIKLS